MTSTSTSIQSLPTAPARFNRVILRALAVVLAALAFSGAGAAFSPAQASAGTADSAVRFCAPYAQMSAYLYAYNFNTGSWEYVNRAGTSGTTGCATFSRVDSGRYYTVRAYLAVGAGQGSRCLTNPYSLYVLDGYTPYGYAESGQDPSTSGRRPVATRYVCPGMG